MDLFWVPSYLTLLIYPTTMLIMRVKGYKIHWSEETGDKITMLVVGMLFILSGSFLFFEPNGLIDKGTSEIHAYTFGRQLGIIMMGMVILTTFTTLYELTDEQSQKIECMQIKFFYMLFMVSASISGAYGFLTRTSWGLLKITYISDTFSWWLELVFCIVGCIGIWAYFKYIQHWQGIDRSK